MKTRPTDLLRSSGSNKFPLDCTCPWAMASATKLILPLKTLPGIPSNATSTSSPGRTTWSARCGNEMLKILVSL